MPYLAPAILIAAHIASGGEQEAALAAAAAVQAEVPSGPHRFAYTDIGAAEVVFLDLNSIVRNVDVVEGWGLNILAAPLAAFGSSPADLYWTKIRIDCVRRVGRFTHAIAIVDGAQAFNGQVQMPDAPTDENWVMDEAYGCNGAQPTQPVFEQVDDAVHAARSRIVEAAAKPAT